MHAKELKILAFKNQLIPWDVSVFEGQGASREMIHILRNLNALNACAIFLLDELKQEGRNNNGTSHQSTITNSTR